MIYTVGFSKNGFPSATIKEALNYLELCSYIGLDIETTRKFNGRYGSMEGLDPYTSNIIMIQMGDINRQYIFDARKIPKETITALFNTLDKRKPKFVGHNLKFEFKHIYHNYGYKLHTCVDTMLMETIIMNGLSFGKSLKDLIKKYLGNVVDKDIRMTFLTIKDRPFTDDQINYGANDILLPLRFFNKQLTEITDKGMSYCFNLESSFLKVLALMEYNGFQINTKKWLDLAVINKKKYKEQERILTDMILEVLPEDSRFIDKQYDLFSSDVKLSISLSSSTQVIELFKYLGVKCEVPDKKTKLLKPTVEAKALKSYLVVNSKVLNKQAVNIVKEYLNFKKLEQSCTTFGEAFVKKYVHPITGRLHSNFTQIIETGRMASSNPKVNWAL